MPVNLPTHGHGQGFADLNFLIPELVSGVRYRKGPYSVDAGDFSLAGSASMDYFSTLERPFAQITLGPDNYKRTLIAGARSDDDHTWLGALEGRPSMEFELDAALSRARFEGTAPSGEGNYSDNAVARVVTAGVNWQDGRWTRRASLGSEHPAQSGSPLHRHQRPELEPGSIQPHQPAGK